MPEIVDRSLVGYIPGTASPTRHRERLGRASLSPAGPLVVRSHAPLLIRYEVGHHGVDDRGGLKVMMRFPFDGGDLQLTDPTARNYVSAEASRPVGFRLRYEGFGGERPWFRELEIKVVGGCLVEGDVVSIRLGDTRQGGPGLRMQTFCEGAWELRLLVDAAATGHYVEVPGSMALELVPGPPERWVAVLPTHRRPGQPFSLGLKAEDAWGNPAVIADRELVLEPSMPVEGLPATARFSGQRALKIEGLRAARPGVLRVAVREPGGALLTASNPLVVGDGTSAWGDLHGQTGETVGINTAEHYFRFARDLAFLDISSHQGNDFQINRAFWARLDELTARFNQPGRFLAIPGYEWSGNTGVGGDRNVYFRREGQVIRRSSHALLTDHSDEGTDCSTAAALLEALADEDAVTFAHVGGRWADIRLAHDGRVERSVEIHSAWGTFEWLLHDAFELGYRVGVVCNSDGHKGRPGASYPGASTFGAYGGLTCFLMPALTRDALFECLRARRHYGTTGCRLALDVWIGLNQPGWRYPEDPAVATSEPERVDAVGMGDIAAVAGDGVAVAVRVAAPAPIERVEVRIGREVVHTWRPYGEAELGDRVRVEWQGASYRGRGRQVCWDGRARLSGARVLRAARYSEWNPERAFAIGSRELRWEAVTTGNAGGFDAWLDGLSGALEVETALCSFSLPLASLGVGDRVFEAGGLERAVRVRRLPAALTCREASFSCRVPLLPGGDTPIWVCVILEDGHRAWSSPAYLLGGAA